MTQAAKYFLNKSGYLFKEFSKYIHGPLGHKTKQIIRQLPNQSKLTLTRKPIMNKTKNTVQSLGCA